MKKISLEKKHTEIEFNTKLALSWDKIIAYKEKGTDNILVLHKAFYKASQYNWYVLNNSETFGPVGNSDAEVLIRIILEGNQDIFVFDDFREFIRWCYNQTLIKETKNKEVKDDEKIIVATTVPELGE